MTLTKSWERTKANGTASHLRAEGQGHVEPALRADACGTVQAWSFDVAGTVHQLTSPADVAGTVHRLTSGAPYTD